MASIRQDKRTGRYLIVFRYSGRQFQRGLKTTSRKEADAARARVDETIRLIDRGRLEIPDGADPVTFILSDGTQTNKPVAQKQLTLGELLQMYDEGRIERAKEDTTVVTERIHLKHLRKYLPLRNAGQSVAVADVQRYVARRLKDKWRGQPIGADTVRREVTTLRLIWNWAEREGHVTGRAPTHDIQYPKRDEKHPFMTKDEIERIINRGGLTELEEKELWESLFLKANEVSELLPEVQKAARRPFIYPMFVFVAHTGARRSEILRSQIDDFDFDARIVKIREKKRSKKNAITYRHVPMTALLQSVMHSWFAIHPGGKYTFGSQSQGVDNVFAALTVHQAVDHFERTIGDTGWKRVRGFHVFRHSFASNLAAAAVDQRIIDEWMGHQTEEMRRRYRHLFPEQQRRAIDLVFGRGGKEQSVA